MASLAQQRQVGVHLQSHIERLPADDARVARVAAHFKRTESMMQLLDEVQLPSDLEIAEIYNPKQTRV